MIGENGLCLNLKKCFPKRPDKVLVPRLSSAIFFWDDGRHIPVNKFAMVLFWYFAELWSAGGCCVLKTDARVCNRDGFIPVFFWLVFKFRNIKETECWIKASKILVKHKGILGQWALQVGAITVLGRKFVVRTYPLSLQCLWNSKDPQSHVAWRQGLRFWTHTENASRLAQY